jgi:L-ascorbate metabolism protein UlaG (beta-lactamase superfamily)
MINKLIFYGHATYGLELDSHTVLIDPYLTENPVASIKKEDVPADFILISHAHNDHFADAISIAKRTRALCISVVEITKVLAKEGISVHPQHIGGGYQHPFGHLKLVNAAHGSGFLDGSYGGNPAGLLITTHEGKKLYFAADTGLFGDMQLIGEEGIDLAFLPIGDNFTMGPADALRAVKLIHPKLVIPFHYNTWEIIQQDAEAWAKAVEKETSAKARILLPGETMHI